MKFKMLHKNVKIRLIEGFFGSLLGNMVFPFMVVYFADYFGASLAGILSILTVIIGFFSNFYGGYLSDKYGRKKIMVYAQIAFFISYAGMAIFNSSWFLSPWLTYVMMVVNSTSWGFMGPAAQAMLIDVTEPQNRKFVFGMNYWLMNLALSISGFVGGFLFKGYRFELFCALTAMSLISLLLLVFFIDETYIPSEEKKSKKSKGVFLEMASNYKLVFKDKVFMIFTFGNLLLGSLEWQARNYSSVRLDKEFGNQLFFGTHWNGLQIFGLLASENSILVVILGLITPYLLHKFKDKSMLFLATLLSVIGFAFMDTSNYPVVLIISMFVATVGEVLWVPVSQSLSAELPPEDNRSAYMAVQGITFRGKQVLGFLAVTIGAYFNSYVVAVALVISGWYSFYLISKVLERKRG